MRWGKCVNIPVCLLLSIWQNNENNFKIAQVLYVFHIAEEMICIEAIAVLQVGWRIQLITQEKSSFSFLMQRLSVAVQRIIGTVPLGWTVLYLILFLCWSCCRSEMKIKKITMTILADWSIDWLMFHNTTGVNLCHSAREENQFCWLKIDNVEQYTYINYIQNYLMWFPSG